MATLVVANLDIHDREGYRRYEAGFMQIFARHTGRMISVSDNATVLEGDYPFTRTVVIEFPDEVAARAWYDDADYQALMEHRHATSTGHVIMIDTL